MNATNKPPFMGISSIQSAIENMKLPYDYKHTAFILHIAATNTQRRLAIKRSKLLRSFSAKRLKVV